MIQSTNINKILQIMCLALLASCGGGGENNSSLPEPNPLSSYTGSTDPALLDETNTIKFSDMLLGTPTEAPFLNRQTQSSAIVLNNQQLLISSLLKATSLTRGDTTILRACS